MYLGQSNRLLMPPPNLDEVNDKKENEENMGLP